LSNPRDHRITVLGGGITGLSAAYRLALARRAGVPVQGVLLEAGPRLGGLIRTEEVNRFILEAGPDSFLSEKPEAAELCRQLSLEGSLIGSNDRERRTYILHSGALRRNRLVVLPEGLVLFVPTELRSILSTPLLPLGSKLAILRDWFRRAPVVSPATPISSEPGWQMRGPAPRAGGSQELDTDESVASFVTRHFGSAMVENIADPLLAGIFGGDSARLSVRSVLPRFWEMGQKSGSSLTRAVLESRKQRQSQAEPAPLFLTLKPGLETLVRALADQLESAHVYLEKRITAIEQRQHSQASRGLPSSTGSYMLHNEAGDTLETDAVILALPSRECACILAEFDPSLSDELAAITYTSAMTVALGYGPGVHEKLPRGFGFLVPYRERHRLLACTFVHSKFEHRAPAGHALLRCFLGGARDPAVLSLSDAEVLAVVRQELSAILNLTVEPEFFRIFRWPSAIPQYEVGHAARLRAIGAKLEQHPGLFLAGNIFSGIGISDCIRSGQAAAVRALEALTVGNSDLKSCTTNS
jgi:oxygen-dependent protoporphyrinogen oxidase